MMLTNSLIILSISDDCWIDLFVKELCINYDCALTLQAQLSPAPPPPHPSPAPLPPALLLLLIVPYIVPLYNDEWSQHVYCYRVLSSIIMSNGNIKHAKIMSSLF